MLSKIILEGPKEKLDLTIFRDQKEYFISFKNGKALNSIKAKDSGEILLSGITSSGKTEVYKHFIKDLINKGKSALVLVPEIFLTPQIFNNFQKDNEAWVAIVTGSGDRAFSAGNDLKYQAEGGKMESVPSGFAGLTSRYDLNKPIIAAVNGVAMGGGFEIALACDLIIASDNATFALPEPKVGLAALAGGMHRLPRQIGLKRAMGMMLTGRTVKASEGKELGFVNEVVSQEELLIRAEEWAKMIMECSPVSIRTTKNVALDGLNFSSIEELSLIHI